MKVLASAPAATLFIEIGQSSLQAASGADVFSFPLERGENGRLTDLCRERLTVSLSGFLGKKPGLAARNALCAIGARGVSLRRLTLPAVSKEEWPQVLRLQIESEFPLSPDELAWGSRLVGQPKPSGNSGPARQEVLVVAVKKEVVEEYAAILSACGVAPTFTLAALALLESQPLLTGTCAVLDIGRTHSELMMLAHGLPVSVRILGWGGEQITRSVENKLGLSHDEAEKLKLAMDQPGGAMGAHGEIWPGVMEAGLADLVEKLKQATPVPRLYLTGKSARDPRLAPGLSRLLGGAITCESLPQTSGAGGSAVIAGLKEATSKPGALPPLTLAMNGAPPVTKAAGLASWKWAAAAVFLALGLLLFPYAEALVLKPFLEKKLAALENDRGRLTTIDQELDFLKFLKQSQPPYFDTVYLLAKLAPPGTKVDALTMGTHQGISLELKMANAEQLSDFRAKLIDSGWFANVVAEEQTPTPDRRVSVRMTMELKPVESRKPLAAELPAKKKES